MVATSTSLPLNENDEVRATTCRSFRRESEFSSSSLMPSEKYSWLGSPLMFTNGSTATECGGGANAAAAGAAGAIAADGKAAACLAAVDDRYRSIASQATATPATVSAATSSQDLESLAAGRFIAAGRSIKCRSGAAPCGRCTALSSFANAASVPSAARSIHCDSLKKYSNALVSCAASVRSAMIGRRLDDARSTSLPTCGEAIELPESTSTRTLESLMALMMPSAYSAPGVTSRGAIQHLSPCRSSPATTALAMAASCEA